MAITQSIHGPRPKFLVPSSSTPPRLSETALTFGHTMSLGGAMGCLRKGVILLWTRFHVKRAGQKTLELGFRRGIGWVIDPQVPALFAQSYGFHFLISLKGCFFTHRQWCILSSCLPTSVSSSYPLLAASLPLI